MYTFLEFGNVQYSGPWHKSTFISKLHSMVNALFTINVNITKHLLLAHTSMYCSA